MRLAVGAAEDMQGVQRRIVVVLDVHGHDVQPRQLVQLFQIVEERILDQVAGDVPLEQRSFEFAEQMRLVVAELWLEPVLREQEDLSVGLPTRGNASSIPTAWR